MSSNDEEFARTRGERVIAGLDRWIQNYFDLSLQKEKRKLFSQPRSCKPVAGRQIRLTDVLYLAHTAFCGI